LRRTTEVDHDIVVLVSGDHDREPTGPLGVVVGRSLLVDACCDTPIQELVVPSAADPSECAAFGEELDQLDARVAVVALGDGSARRGVKAPGYLDPRAASWDAAVTAALVAPDWAAVASLDPRLAEDLMSAGRASWQVLAGALSAAERHVSGPRSRWKVAEHFAGDPFGVWYFVLSFRRDA
jgi:hypothetical protein